MLVTRWLLLLGSILLPMCSALMLNESKTYALRVPDNGIFTFIICGNITGNFTEVTKICYDGKAKSNEHHSCQKESYCAVQVSQNAGNNFLTAVFGGSGGLFNETCVKIQVEKHKQIALNPKDKVANGTCTWNATDEGKLLVDVTLSKDFTVEVENAVLYEEVKTQKAGLLPEHLHWVIPVGSVIGAVVVVVIIVALVYCYCCKKKKQPEVGKQPSLAIIPPTKPRSTTVEINMIEKLMAKEGSLTPNAKKSQSNVLVKEGDEVKRQPSKTSVLCVDQPLNAPSFVSTPNVEKCTTSEEKQGVQPEVVKEVCPQIIAIPKTAIVEMDKKIAAQEEVKQEIMPLKTGVEEGGRNKEEMKMKVKKMATQKEVEQVAAKTPLIPVGGKKDNDKLRIKKDGEKTTTEETAGPSRLTKTSMIEKTGRTKTEVEKKATKTTSEDDLRTGRLSNVSTPIAKTPRTSVDGNKNKDNVGIKNDGQKTTTEEEPQPGPSKMETKFLIGRDGRKMEVKREVATTQKGIKTREGARTASGSELDEEETQASEISNVFQRSLKKSMSGESKKKVRSRSSSKKTKSGKSKSKSGKSKKTKSGKSSKGSRSGQSKKERRTRRLNYDSLSAEEEADLRHHLNTNEPFRQAFDKIARGENSDEPDVKTAEEKKSVVEEFYPGYLSRGLLQPTVSTDLIVRKRRSSADSRQTDSTDN